MLVKGDRSDLPNIKDIDLLNEILENAGANLRHRSRLRSSGFNRVWNIEVWEASGKLFTIYFEPIGSKQAPATGWTVFLPGSASGPAATDKQLRALERYLGLEGYLAILRF